jgi:hypothetical protein
VPGPVASIIARSCGGAGAAVQCGVRLDCCRITVAVGAKSNLCEPGASEWGNRIRHNVRMGWGGYYSTTTGREGSGHLL